MTLTAENAGRVSAAIYSALSLAAGLAFLVVTLSAGDYSWVSRIGGALWVAALTLIILMPTVTPIVVGRAGRASSRTDGMPAPERSVEMARDPVCGMDVDPATAAGSSDYKGKTYYFCAPGCKKSFDEDPEKYLAA